MKYKSLRQWDSAFHVLTYLIFIHFMDVGTDVEEGSSNTISSGRTEIQTLVIWLQSLILTTTQYTVQFILL